jgi:hypothetical protein
VCLCSGLSYILWTPKFKIVFEYVFYSNVLIDLFCGRSEIDVNEICRHKFCYVK